MVQRHLRALVSVKGVIWHEDTVVLLQTKRGDWELPGGKLEVGELPMACLVREFQEELQPAVTPGPVLAAALHHVYPDIFVVIYGCRAARSIPLALSHEHLAVRRFSAAELDGLDIAAAYRDASLLWLADPRRSL